MNRFNGRLAKLEAEAERIAAAQRAAPSEPSADSLLMAELHSIGGNLVRGWFDLVDQFKTGGQEPSWRLDEPEVMRQYIAARLMVQCYGMRNPERYLFLLTIFTNATTPVGRDAHYFFADDFLKIRDGYEFGDDPPMRLLAINWREEQLRRIIDHQGDVYAAQWTAAGVPIRSLNGIFGIGKVQTVAGPLFYQRGDVFNVTPGTARLLTGSPAEARQATWSTGWEYVSQ